MLQSLPVKERVLENTVVISVVYGLAGAVTTSSARHLYGSDEHVVRVPRLPRREMKSLPGATSEGSP